jgi:hypothetical protein
MIYAGIDVALTHTSASSVIPTKGRVGARREADGLFVCSKGG